MIHKATLSFFVALLCYTYTYAQNLGDSVQIGLTGRWSTFISFQDDTNTVLSKLKSIPIDWSYAIGYSDTIATITLRTNDKQIVRFFTFANGNISSIQLTDYYCAFSIQQLRRMFKNKVVSISGYFTSRSKDESLFMSGEDAVEMSYVSNSALYKYYVTPCYEEINGVGGLKCYGIATYINKYLLRAGK
jgi:hypothetical protein